MNNRFDIESLAKLFQPSLWSERYPTSEQVLSAHIAFSKSESDRIRSKISFETVKYGERFTNETFDIYGIDLPKDAPVFVYIHGGYWQALDKTVSAYVVEPLYKAGHKVIVLDYDICPNVTLEQLVDQIHRAGISIVNYAKSIGTRCVQIGGHSAGGHLAACLYDNLVQQSPSLTSIVKSLYLISGVYDICELRYMPTVNPNNILSLDENNVLRLSPILFDFDKWITVAASEGNSVTAIHMYVGSKDAPKLVGQSYCIERILAHYLYPKFRLIMIETTDHFDIVENLSQANFLITKDIINEAKTFFPSTPAVEKSLKMVDT
ncbi:kynurenine formamidase [Contarinia nasturtii]|uniref:kynurenine formamidase n=1 Tax=Contarinia nasturtii TaxID=265458 RepID=UPI0012D46E04|nr:kynurenine formamidase [Contarinia nasturtii]XP_031622294.1 kynurenine formamidase [Contarinia nasturtii]